jgi:hypothetical protein
MTEILESHPGVLVNAKLLDTSIDYKRLRPRPEIQAVPFYCSLSGAMSVGGAREGLPPREVREAVSHPPLCLPFRHEQGGQA